MSDCITEDLGRRSRPLLRDSAPGPGSVLGAWRLESLIAEGGCGSVFRGRHVMLERPAAIKLLHPALADDPSMVARFMREAQAVNRIRHPNIVEVFDAGMHGVHPYLVMELLDVANLEDRLELDGRLTLAECVEVIAPLASALTAVHAAGFIHRDIKARNVGFTVATPHVAATVKLLDFGIAKLLTGDGGPASSATMRLGTPHCIAPEQIRGQAVDARTDVYALGVLLYHLATAVYPFDADDSHEVERMHLDTPPPLPSDLVPSLAVIDELVADAMAKDRARRPASAAEFLSRLEEAATPRVTRTAGFRRRASARRAGASGRWWPGR